MKKYGWTMIFSLVMLIAIGVGTTFDSDVFAKGFSSGGRSSSFGSSSRSSSFGSSSKSSSFGSSKPSVSKPATPTITKTTPAPTKPAEMGNTGQKSTFGAVNKGKVATGTAMTGTAMTGAVMTGQTHTDGGKTSTFGSKPNIAGSKQFATPTGRAAIMTQQKVANAKADFNKSQEFTKRTNEADWAKSRDSWAAKQKEIYKPPTDVSRNYSGNDRTVVINRYHNVHPSGIVYNDPFNHNFLTTFSAVWLANHWSSIDRHQYENDARFRELEKEVLLLRAKEGFKEDRNYRDPGMDDSVMYSEGYLKAVKDGKIKEDVYQKTQIIPIQAEEEGSSILAFFMWTIVIIVIIVVLIFLFGRLRRSRY